MSHRHHSDRKHHCDDKNKWEKIKNLCVKNLKSKNIDTDKLTLNGIDLACALGNPTVLVNQGTYDCVDCDGNIIKPDFLNQDVWDFLSENREEFRQKTEEDLLRGRNEIRCIRQAYGCVQCPPDCPVPATCSPIFTGEFSQDGEILTVISVEPDTGKLVLNSSIILEESGVELGTLGSQISGEEGAVGTYNFVVSLAPPEGVLNLQSIYPCPTPGPTGPCAPVPAECLPDPDTCDLFVPVKTYATMTIPWAITFEGPCGPTGANTFSFPMNIGFDLDVTNVTCNLAPRSVTILLHYAYIEGGNTGSTGPPDPCPVCPDRQEPSPFECLYEPLGSNISCGVLRYNCRQIYYTLNIEIGESFSNVINIPTPLIQQIRNATPNYDSNNITGAFQLAIFVEDGLEIRNNAFNRGQGPPKNAGSQAPTIASVGPNAGSWTGV